MECQRKFSARWKSQRGFTITEVLIAALIGSFVIAAGVEVFINQNKGHLIQAGITEMQQNGRATIDELTSKIRQAGYRMQPGMRCLGASNSNPDTITIAFIREPICSAGVSENMASPSTAIKCTGSDVSCIPVDGWAYIYDPNADAGEYFWVSGADEALSTVQHASDPLSKAYPLGSRIYVLDFYKYYVDDSDSLLPKLIMEKNGGDPVVFADNILDMQLRYRMANGALYDTIAVDRYVREVLIEVVTRTEKNDLFMSDHRYDTLRSSTMVRNLSM